MSWVKGGNFSHRISIPAHDTQRAKHDLQTICTAADLQTSGLIFRVVRNRCYRCIWWEGHKTSPSRLWCSGGTMFYNHDQIRLTNTANWMASSTRSPACARQDPGRQINCMISSLLLTSQHVLYACLPFSVVELLRKIKISAETQWFGPGIWALIVQKWSIHSQIHPGNLPASPRDARQ